MSNAVKELNDADFESSVRSADLAIVDVYASWCGSCRLFAPVFKEVAAGHPEFSFFQIDGEKNPAFTEKVEIDNLPFVAVFHKGEYVGGQNTTKKEKLEEMIKIIREKTSGT